MHARLALGLGALWLITVAGCNRSARSDGGCKSDSDCKGDRVCTAGTCQSPATAKDPPAAAAFAVRTKPSVTMAAPAPRPAREEPAHDEATHDDSAHEDPPPTRAPVAPRPAARPAAGSVDVICADPFLPCPGPPRGAWQSYELGWQVPAGRGARESGEFYAVLLGSTPAVPDDGPGGGKKCKGFFDETARLKAQNDFPRHKVFTSRFGCSDTAVYYTSTNTSFNFIAVFAGNSDSDAAIVLRDAQGTGRYIGANIRRMRAGWNARD